MGGKIFALAAVVVLAMGSPAFAGQENYKESQASSRQVPFEYANPTVVQSKEQMTQSAAGGATQMLDRTRTQTTKHIQTDTYTTFNCTWEDVSSENQPKDRQVWAVVGSSFSCPCECNVDDYGWTSVRVDPNMVTVRRPGSKSEERLTNSTKNDNQQADSFTAWRVAATMGAPGGGGASIMSAGGSGGSMVGRQAGFTGDSGAGEKNARTASAGRTISLSGADKAAKSKGQRLLTLTGAWSNGLTIAEDNGGFVLTKDGIGYAAELRGSKLKSPRDGKAVSLEIRDGGNELEGTFAGKSDQEFSRGGGNGGDGDNGKKGKKGKKGD